MKMLSNSNSGQLIFLLICSTSLCSYFFTVIVTLLLIFLAAPEVESRTYLLLFCITCFWKNVHDFGAFRFLKCRHYYWGINSNFCANYNSGLIANLQIKPPDTIRIATQLT